MQEVWPPLVNSIHLSMVGTSLEDHWMEKLEETSDQLVWPPHLIKKEAGAHKENVYWSCRRDLVADPTLEFRSPDSHPFIFAPLSPWLHSCLYYYSTDKGIWPFPWRKIVPVIVCLERYRVRWKENWTWSQKRCAWPWASHLSFEDSVFLFGRWSQSQPFSSHRTVVMIKWSVCLKALYML